MNKITSVGFITILTTLTLAGCTQPSEEPVIDSNFPTAEQPAVEPKTDTEANSDWQIYENKELGFVLKLPAEASVEKEVNDEHNQLVSFTSEGKSIDVKLNKIEGDKTLKAYEDKEWYQYEVSKISKTTLGGNEAVVVEASKGACDGPGCSEPFIDYITINEGYTYSITFFGDVVLSETENKILESFKFSGAVTPTEAPNALQPVEK